MRQRGHQGVLAVAEEEAIAQLGGAEVEGLEALGQAVQRLDLGGKGPLLVKGRQERSARAMRTMESSGVTSG